MGFVQGIFGGIAGEMGALGALKNLFFLKLTWCLLFGRFLSFWPYCSRPLRPFGRFFKYILFGLQQIRAKIHILKVNTRYTSPLRQGQGCLFAVYRI